MKVAIGRFQTPYLTEGHKAILAKADLVLIGTTPAINEKNPLSFEVRKGMIEEFGRLVEELPDHPCDIDWSNNIDSIIDTVFRPSNHITIFGGRDNSLDSYCGKHEVKIIDGVGGESGTELRADPCKNLINMFHDHSFRAGMIHQQNRQYPTVYSTVDVALLRQSPIEELFAEGQEVLMGNKGDGFHFIGGFVDPSDESHEAAALRELKEETGIELEYLRFLCSSKVNDKRYKGTKDSIMTNLFTYSGYCHLPKEEDIKDKEFKEFQWIPLEEKSLEKVSETHKPLFKQLLVRI